MNQFIETRITTHITTLIPFLKNYMPTYIMPTTMTTATVTAKVSNKYEKLRKQWFLCECAGSYTKSNKSFHMKTKKHQQFLEMQATHPI